MHAQTFLSPARIHFGPGSLEHLGQEAASLGKKALIVTGRSSAKKSGSLDAIRTILEEAGVAIVEFAKVESDPSVATVEEGTALAKAQECDLIVALGGGSPIDAAKGISCLLANPGPIQDYETKAPPLPGPPLIAIPTTAGTGSEVTRMSVLTDTVRKRKMLLAGPSLMPTVAILDPVLTATMPPRVAAATGMDALTHAVEAYLSKAANPLSDTLALAAIERIGASLVKAVTAPDNLEARNDMLLAQMQAGQAFSNASVGLVHAMSRPMGAYFGVPHGVANAMLLPVVAAYNRPACPERMVRVAKALGRSTRHMDLAQASRQAPAALAELLAELPLPRSLGDVGVDPDALTDMAKDAAESGSSRLNPRRTSVEDIIALYHKLS
jgi:1,3-propanediol dehydrogenase/alcohol dehydrogenase